MPDPTKVKRLPSQEELKERFNYNSETGDLTFKKLGLKYFKNAHGMNIFNTQHSGQIAGTLSKKMGYKIVSINKVTYLAHRVVWKWVTGEDPLPVIDHLDGNGINNRFENLATYKAGAENARNRRISIHNSTGRTGVQLIKKTGKWRARCYDDYEDACWAREQWEIENDFTERHGVEV